MKNITYRQVRDGPHSYLVSIEALPNGTHKATVSGLGISVTGDSVDTAMKNLERRLIEKK